MKKLSVFLALFVVAAVAIATFPSAKGLVGHWKITYKNGTFANINMRANGTFEAEFPSEHFVVGGKYRYGQDIIKFSDTTCNADYWGSYKLTSHGADSIWSDVVEDTCGGRRSAADKVFLVRQQ